ncbi:MAG: pectin acetylesterase-family hydrolase, partial [Gemmatimonadota bacterium]
MRPLSFRCRQLLLIQLLISFPALLAAQTWEAVIAGGRCPAGTPWQFWIHRGRLDRVLFYLEGGGACWTPGTCDLKGRATFDPSVDEQDNPANADGILKLDQPANPFRGWSVVFVPYCTADVHLGTRTVTYEPGITIDHRGAANVRDALAWVKKQLPGLTRIVVAGGSAGAIPTPVYAARLAGMYPTAAVTGIGDGAGGYRSPAIAGILVRWGVKDGLADLPA